MPIQEKVPLVLPDRPYLIAEEKEEKGKFEYGSKNLLQCVEYELAKGLFHGVGDADLAVNDSVCIVEARCDFLPHQKKIISMAKMQRGCSNWIMKTFNLHFVASVGARERLYPG